jgi:hypothetical protein
MIGKDRGGLRFRLKELMMGKRIPFRLDLILQRLMDPLGRVFLPGSESFDEPLTTSR